MGHWLVVGKIQLLGSGRVNMYSDLLNNGIHKLSFKIFLNIFIKNDFEKINTK